jgi:hypothetical protein
MISEVSVHDWLHPLFLGRGEADYHDARRSKFAHLMVDRKKEMERAWDKLYLPRTSFSNQALPLKVPIISQ